MTESALAPPCSWCGEPVAPGDPGARHHCVEQPIHWECGLRSVVGGLNHLNQRCTCCGGAFPPDPEGMTRREAARAAAQVWLARNPPLQWD